jgi:excisionase family DNA binding protein
VIRIEVAEGFVLELSPERFEELRQLQNVKGVLHLPNVQAPTHLLSTEEVAKRIGMSRDYVYRHAEELGGQKFGSQWRFPPERPNSQTSVILRSPKQGEANRQTSATPRPRRITKAGKAPLLEVRGEAPYPAPSRKQPPEAFGAPPRA